MNRDNMIEVDPLDKIKQEERIAIISNELITMKSKKMIIDEYSVKWNCSPATIRAIINESIVWLSTQGKVTREEMRILNSERLDTLFGEARSVKDKLKIIDILNKAHGVYETNLNIGNKEDDVIKIDIGV